MKQRKRLRNLISKQISPCGRNDSKEFYVKVTMESQPNNPLHGVKLATIVEKLHDHYGWDGLADRININCFKSNPSVKSSLKFLRRTPWPGKKWKDFI